MEAVNNYLQEISAESIFNNNPIVIKERIARRKPLFKESDGNNKKIGSGISMASFFSIIDSMQDLDNQAFSAFIANRKDYLNSLKYLGENWISGQSFAPNEQALNIGLELLEYFDQWYSNVYTYLNGITPSIIMGPIAVGGISFEISKFQDVKLYINIYNNGQIEMEFDNNGYFSEVNTTDENYKSKVAEFLSDYEIWNNYSGWRSPLQIC